MKIQRSSYNKNQSIVVPLENTQWLDDQRYAGRVLAKIMLNLQQEIVNKSGKSLIDYSEFVDHEITKAGCSAIFKNYKGFPAACCISVNQTLVHGIPTSYRLQEGDLVSFDFGVKYNESMVDSAKTFIFGKEKSKNHVDLINATNLSLEKAIKSIRLGEKMGIIGYTISRTAKKLGFNVINELGGHGISRGRIHASPFVPNKSNPDEGIRFQAGMTFAIEPLLIGGFASDKIHISNDGWSVECTDYCAHAEHTVFLHNDYIEVLTETDPLKIKVLYENII